MTKTTTLHQSLSFDTISKVHASRADAEAYMVKVLTREGWSQDEAIKAAARGTPVLVVDEGDDETIEIRSL